MSSAAVIAEVFELLSAEYPGWNMVRNHRRFTEYSDITDELVRSQFH